MYRISEPEQDEVLGDHPEPDVTVEVKAKIVKFTSEGVLVK